MTNSDQGKLYREIPQKGKRMIKSKDNPNLFYGSVQDSETNRVSGTALFEEVELRDHDMLASFLIDLIEPIIEQLGDKVANYTVDVIMPRMAEHIKTSVLPVIGQKAREAASLSKDIVQTARGDAELKVTKVLAEENEKAVVHAGLSRPKGISDSIDEEPITVDISPEMMELIMQRILKNAITMSKDIETLSKARVAVEGEEQTLLEQRNMQIELANRIPDIITQVLDNEESGYGELINIIQNYDAGILTDKEL